MTARKHASELVRHKHDDTTDKQCCRCRKWFPRASGFYRRSAARDGLAAACKICDDSHSKAHKRNPDGPDVLGAQKQGRFCKHCGSLPHRVEGDTCRGCGLAFAAEAPPEPELRRFDDIRARC